MSVRFNNISWPSLYSPAIEVGFSSPPTRPGGYYLTEPDGTTSPPFEIPRRLTNPISDIFTFTLYWTLIFHLPFNFVAGIYAFFNFLFPPARTVRNSIALVSSPRPHLQSHSRDQSLSHSFSQPQSQSHSRSQSQTQAQAHTQIQTQAQLPAPAEEWLKPPRLNPRRSRWTFALLVFFAFLVISLLSAVVGAAVLAFVIVGVYRGGGFYVSTCVLFPSFCFVPPGAGYRWPTRWIPFIWAVIQSLIALLEYVRSISFRWGGWLMEVSNRIWPSVIDII